jgi:hypothetical protein
LTSASEWQNLLLASSLSDFDHQPWKQYYWQKLFACDGYYGEPIQYSLTYACLTDIFYFSSGCNEAAGAHVPDVPVCQETCDNFGSALGGLISDTTACSASKPATLDADSWARVQSGREGALKGAESCSTLLSEWKYEVQPKECSDGVDDDFKTCGFGGNVNAAATYCYDIKDQAPCCETFHYYVEKGYTGIADIADVSSLIKPPPGSVAASNSIASNLWTSSTSALKAMGIDTEDTIKNAENTFNDAVGKAENFYDNNRALAIGLAVGGISLLIVIIGVSVYIARRRRNTRVGKSGGNGGIIGGKLGRMGTTKRIPPPSAAVQAERDAADRRLLSSNGAPASSVMAKKTVMISYEPELPDEVKLDVGQVVIVHSEYEDGWGRGQVVQTGMIGAFPLACLEGHESDS